MTASEEKIIDKAIKKTTLIGTSIGILAAVFAALGVCYGFYYNTTTKLENHDLKIDTIQKQINVLDEKHLDDEIFKGTYKVEIQSINDKVEKIDEKQDMMISMMAEYFLNKEKN